MHRLEAMRGTHEPFELALREDDICFFHWGLESCQVMLGCASGNSGVLEPFFSLHFAGSHLVSNVVLPPQLLPVLASWQHFQLPKFAPHAGVSGAVVGTKVVWYQ